MKVWKYELSITDDQTVVMPRGAKILSAQNQYEKVTIWALVNEYESITEKVHFHIAGTAHPLPKNPMEFIDTIQLSEGKLVLHVFKVLTDAEIDK